jgi:hypothetical protein
MSPDEPCARHLIIAVQKAFQYSARPLIFRDDGGRVPEV